jgi:flagellar protein FliO/FliZ
VDLLDYLRFLGALAVVLALLVGFALLLRKYGHRLGALGLAAPQSARRRLAVIESIGLGPRQRLTIVRRDNVEHLLLLGPEGARVVESGIRADA